MLNLARILTQLDIPWQRSLMFVRPLDTLPSAHSVPSGQLFCVPNKLILDTDETVKMKPFLVFCQRCFCTKLKVPRTVNMNITWIGIGPYNYRPCKKPSYWLLALFWKTGGKIKRERAYPSQHSKMEERAETGTDCADSRERQEVFNMWFF